jgi:hypothetical protein
MAWKPDGSARIAHMAPDSDFYLCEMPDTFCRKMPERSRDPADPFRQ